MISRYFLTAWLVLNLLSLPLAVYSQPEVESSVSVQTQEQLGYWGRISTFSLDPEQDSQVKVEERSFPIIYLLLVLAVSLIITSRMEKSAQVTIFMLLGVIVIGSFSSLYYISQSLTKTKLDAQVDAIVDELLQRTAVEEYITACLAEASKESLYLVGQQSGYIYPYQNGSLFRNMPSTIIEYPEDGFNRSVYIRPPQERGEVDSLPWYPCECNPGADAQCAPPGTPLCNPYDYEDALITDYEHFLDPSDTSSYAFTNPCCYKEDVWGEFYFGDRIGVMLPLYPLPNPQPWEGISIKDVLDRAIENRTRICADLDLFTDLLGYNIAEGNISVDVSITKNDVVIDMVYPLVVTVLGEEPITRFMKFHSTIPVRLRKVYALAARITEEEISNISATPQDVYDTLQSISPNSFQVPPRLFYSDLSNYESIDSAIELSVRRRPIEDYDIFTIRDLNSRLDDEPYEFVFARKNRWPALDYIGKGIGDYPFNGQRYDFTLSINDSIDLMPHAVDPDEDIIVYRYEGWKEDYDASFDDSDFYSRNCTYFPQRCVERNDTVQPRAWTSSLMYTAAGPCNERCSNYTITPDDVGAHVLKITATDLRAEDYQHIRFLVTDAPKAVARANHSFEEIPWYHASIEDPYTLSAIASSSKFCSDIQFEWTDRSEVTDHPINPHILYKGPSPIWTIPTNVTMDPRSILDMSGTSNPFNKVSNQSVHDINLNLIHSCGNSTLPAELEVNVFQCLPHRSPALSFPYNDEGERFNTSSLFSFDASVPPYNYTESDPFQANHTCCLNNSPNYEYAPADTECFRFEQGACAFTDPDNHAGSMIDLNNPLYPANLSENPELPGFIDENGNTLPNPGVDDAHANDFYQRNYSVSCGNSSGTSRGNICDGDKEDTFQRVEKCGLCQFCDPTVEGCNNYSTTRAYVCKHERVCTDFSVDYPTAVPGGPALVVGLCNGSGGCNRVANPGQGINTSSYIVSNNGLLDIENRFVSVNCAGYYNGYDYTTDGGEPARHVESDRVCADTCYSADNTQTGVDLCESTTFQCAISPGSDNCQFTGLDDLDRMQQMCESCNAPSYKDNLGGNPVTGSQGTAWIAEGESAQFGEYGIDGGGDLNPSAAGTEAGGEDISGSIIECCGDDEYEHVRQCELSSPAFDVGCGSSATVCCDQATDCSYDNTCTASGSFLDIHDPNADNETCYQGVWYDQDYNETMCRFDWEDDDEYDLDPSRNRGLGTVVGMCCGDDNSPGYGNESDVVDCKSSSPDAVDCSSWTNGENDSCCPAADWCVGYDGSVGCFEPGQGHEVWGRDGDSNPEIEFCDAGTWVDPDSSEAACTTSGLAWMSMTYTQLFNYAIDDNDSDYSNGFCCGDDVGIHYEEGTHVIDSLYENLTSGDTEQIGENSCCPHASDCTFEGECYRNESLLEVTGDIGEEVCIDGVWYDPDESAQICQINLPWTQFSSGNYCCGDDDPDDYTYQQCLFGAGCSNRVTTTCCDEESDCYYQAQCFNSDDDPGPLGNWTYGVNAEAMRCWESSWYDPDFNEQSCNRFAEAKMTHDSGIYEYAHTTVDCVSDTCWVPEGTNSSMGGSFGEYGNGFGGEGMDNGNDPATESGNQDIDGDIIECCGDDDGEAYFSEDGGRCCDNSSGDACWSPHDYCGRDISEASNEFGHNSCADGIDNDCDGDIDCADSDCAGEVGPSGAKCCQDDGDCGLTYDLSCGSLNTCECAYTNLYNATYPYRIIESDDTMPIPWRTAEACSASNIALHRHVRIRRPVVSNYDLDITVTMTPVSTGSCPVSGSTVSIFDDTGAPLSISPSGNTFILANVDYPYVTAAFRVYPPNPSHPGCEVTITAYGSAAS